MRLAVPGTDEGMTLVKSAFEPFMQAGAPYAYPAVRTEPTIGFPTAYGVPPLSDRVLFSAENPPVGPHPKGTHRGVGILPLYEKAPLAALEDKALYEFLALFDAIRIGQARERELVFVGGCAAGLLVTSVRAQQIRMTEDVDVAAEVATRAEYANMERRFEALGFEDDLSPRAPICRWVRKGVVVDLLPMKPGSTNENEHQRSSRRRPRGFDRTPGIVATCLDRRKAFGRTP